MLVNYFGPRPMALPTDTLNSGLEGMQAGQAQVNQASSHIARQAVPAQYNLQQNATEFPQQTATPTKATDATGVSVSAMTRELIHLHEGELVFKANARSIEVAKSTFDSLFAHTFPAHDTSSTKSGR